MGVIHIIGYFKDADTEKTATIVLGSEYVSKLSDIEGIVNRYDSILNKVGHIINGILFRSEEYTIKSSLINTEEYNTIMFNKDGISLINSNDYQMPIISNIIFYLEQKGIEQRAPIHLQWIKEAEEYLFGRDDIPKLKGSLRLNSYYYNIREDGLYLIDTFVSSFSSTRRENNQRELLPYYLANYIFHYSNMGFGINNMVNEIIEIYETMDTARYDIEDRIDRFIERNHIKTKVLNLVMHNYESINSFLERCGYTKYALDEIMDIIKEHKGVEEFTIGDYLNIKRKNNFLLMGLSEVLGL